MGMDERKGAPSILQFKSLTRHGLLTSQFPQLQKSLISGFRASRSSLNPDGTLFCRNNNAEKGYQGEVGNRHSIYIVYFFNYLHWCQAPVNVARLPLSSVRTTGVPGLWVLCAVYILIRVLTLVVEHAENVDCTNNIPVPKRPAVFVSTN